MTHKLLSSALSAVFICTLNTAALAADHREAPLVRLDPAADQGDFYAFRDPNDSSKLVLILTVNGFSVPAENTTYHFSPDVRYRFFIDNTGDAVADVSIDTEFSSTAPGSQGFRTTLPNGAVVAGLVTQPSLEPEPNPAIIVDDSSGVSVFAGQRDDPFFFDVVGFNRFLAGTGTFSGTDGFADENVSALVVSIPIHMVSGGRDQLQLWSTSERNLITRRTVIRGDVEQHYGQWKQIERIGNPAVSTALIPPPLKDLYNAGQPVNDATDFAPAIVESLMGLGTNNENIGILASVAVPDTLKLDLNAPDGFPNGRKPADDVVDTLLFFIFNQPEGGIGDGVDANDKSFLDSFPFLAEPHQPL